MAPPYPRVLLAGYPAVIFHSSMKTTKIPLVNQVWALIPEHWCRADQITTLDGKWDSCGHFWECPWMFCWREMLGVATVPAHLSVSAPVGTSLKSQSDTKSPISECPLSFWQGCDLPARAKMPSASLGLKWPHRLVRTQSLRISTRWEPCNSWGTPHWDLQNWILEGKTCKGTYLVRCCPVFSKDHPRLKSRGYENSILLLGRARSACLGN